MSDYRSVEAFRARLERIVTKPREERAAPRPRRELPNGKRHQQKQKDDGQRSAIEALLKSEHRPSYSVIAEKTGVSKQRVGQIAKELKTGDTQ